MTLKNTARIALLLLVGLAGLLPTVARAADLQLGPKDNIAYIGNNLADRMQHHSWLETYIVALHPKLDLTFRNLGFTGDEVRTRPRSANFGSPDQWLTKVQADVVFCFFGYNEALRGEGGLAGFEKDLAAMIDGMRGQKYNGESAPRLVLFSPIAHEDLRSPHLPDGTANNKNLDLYTQKMRQVCETKNVPFVDLFTPSLRLYEAAKKPLTMNGIHLLDHGDQAIAQVIVKALFGGIDKIAANESEIARLREAILDKNYHWFSRYRVVDGFNVYGGRSTLAWHGQSNADVMRREMEMFDIMTANRDARVWAVARGGDLEVHDSNLPEELVVKTNKPGKLPEGRHEYVSGKGAIEHMTIAKGMKVNLFASEEMFPELVNPVQMAVDTDGRLFASVWQSYPHWNPTQPRKDRIICLPDDDGDGVADKCVTFADELNSVTSFEFWGGGMIVAAPPELWFLQDTDGDDRADKKIRILQGISSADTHHSANAMVVGPDGWVYWSRGIFNIANMETPTRTYRSGASGVHRFNPRTFEVEFHFPIGPNPHGDFFDQWGYQFANDGTGGTGSYVNIGKGRGYKKWFQKQWRPVAATGMLSSSHFPEANNGNFLICNTIGFLGVLQHEVQYNGADISAVQIEPIVFSSHQTFRPTDVEIGGDGALYVSDWCNVLIGHMQHNMRDPNRDHQHGRVYRVTYEGRPLLKPAKLKGKSIEDVCRAFYAKENGTRYRARLELSGREASETLDAVSKWASTRDPKKPDDAQALLECLWVFAEHRVPNLDLLRKVYAADEPRVRAAAIRTLGQWGERVAEWESTLVAAGRDESALVRAEAVKAAVSFEGLEAAEVVFEVATRPTDPELDYVLDYARGELSVDRMAQDALRSGKKLSLAAQAYMLRNADVNDLLKLERSEAVYRAILSRNNAPANALREALNGLATMKNESKAELLLTLIETRDADEQAGDLVGVGQLLAELPRPELAKIQRRIERLAAAGQRAETRKLAYVTWISAEQSADDALLAASQSKESLQDFLEAIPAITDEELRGTLYPKIRPLVFDLPTNLGVEVEGATVGQQGIVVDYFYPSASNVALETLAKMTPKASGIVPEIVMNVPQRKEADRFALRFTGRIQIPKTGRYRFFTSSDDGSRLYIGDTLVVNNDGLHGMAEKSGRIKLAAGTHPIVVTYFDNGGGDGLQVSWQGPGFKKQRIPAERLSLSGGETLHDVAIRALASIPGHEEEKVVDLASAVKAGRHRSSAISVLGAIPLEHWPDREVRPMADNLVGYLTEMPARSRTGPSALAAIALAESLSSRLPANDGQALLSRLQNLNVRVIAIGTVPHRMIFDKERMIVEAGKPVEFRFSNSDDMPHNFAITLPGSLEEIGLMAEATANEPDAMTRQYIPKSDKILLASRLLQPGENQALSFEAPKTAGIYPYVCTYPGHWRRMYGALYVVDSIEEYLADPEVYLAAASFPIEDKLLEYSTRGREWKFDELSGKVSPLPAGRSYDVGKELFTVANCIACHQLNGEGLVFGPDLSKLEPEKQTAEYILRSLLEPSKDIADEFRSYAFVLETGDVLTGMITEDTAGTVQVVIDPLAKGKPTTIRKSDILDQTKSELSLMPEGLLNRLSEEEILDLVGYVVAGGNEKHEIYHEGHVHH